jgi:hypothetical protein
MIVIILKRPSLSPTLKWQGFSLAPTCEQALYIVQLHEQNELLKKQVELLSLMSDKSI